MGEKSVYLQRNSKHKQDVLCIYNIKISYTLHIVYAQQNYIIGISIMAGHCQDNVVEKGKRLMCSG